MGPIVLSVCAWLQSCISTIYPNEHKKERTVLWSVTTWTCDTNSFNAFISGSSSPEPGWLPSGFTLSPHSPNFPRLQNYFSLFSLLIWIPVLSTYSSESQWLKSKQTHLIGTRVRESVGCIFILPAVFASSKLIEPNDCDWWSQRQRDKTK